MPFNLEEVTLLLVSMYTTDELRTLARKLDESVVHTLPDGRGALAVAERVAEAVIHRGLDEALRERLLAERPGRAHDIAVLWGRSMDSRRERMAETVSDAIAEQGGDPLRCFQTADGEEDDVLYDTYRAMTLSRSRASWPYIAGMTADYVVNHGGKSDAFFRRAAWLLERCEDEDLVILCEALGVTNGALQEHLRSEGALDHVEWVATEDGVILISLWVEGGGQPVGGTAPKAHGLRHLELIEMLVESRLARRGVHESVEFGCKSGHLNRLIDLFRVGPPVGADGGAR